jgi:glucose-1-phosphate cytidylyltransferase
MAGEGPMKAVILAGGLGTRLSEETDYIPKPMVKIGGRPILWHIMKIYGHYGINEFIICLGYKGYIIKEYFANYLSHMSDLTIDLLTGEMKIHQSESEPWKVTLIDTGLKTDTGGRIRRIRPYLQNETFCLTYGDGVSDVDLEKLISFHRSHGRLATVTAVMPPGRFGIFNMKDDQILSFAEKADAIGSRINGGFFVLEPAAIDYVQGDGITWEGSPMEQMAMDGQLMAYMHDGFWMAMDTIRDKRELERIWSSGRAPWAKWSSIPVASMEGFSQYPALDTAARYH